MATGHLASTFLMGALVVVLVTWAVTGRAWRTYAPTLERAGDDAHPTGGTVSWLVSQPVVWMGGFVALALLLVGGVVAFLSTPSAGLSLGVTVIGAMALLVVAYLLVGVYISATRRGHPRSLAAAETVSVGGALFLLAVVAQLVGG
ncbi:hypothetical protein VB773_15220 [Haloarculaceae archaeon H-GB2-1]|nr:hypothetical protein [Haloarculaceae archaeon H-GB1-1]MEA5387315.1 hypothetical protein [Haloarculaceae archaeon H-GB11]MEA5408781.1 hypothetical protein [Haloarculaceae archaeon H-GB2-1]